jgi:hypothetical protein
MAIAGTPTSPLLANSLRYFRVADKTWKRENFRQFKKMRVPKTAPTAQKRATVDAFSRAFCKSRRATGHSLK